MATMRSFSNARCCFLSLDLEEGPPFLPYEDECDEKRGQNVERNLNIS
jgi:hypothetical protein